MVDASAGVERECPQCSYQVSSATGGQLAPAQRAMPTECPNCEVSLVRVGEADEREEIPEDIRERVEADPVLELSDVKEGGIDV